ncbi:ATP-binding cassette domain-containing protein [Stenotrophomonas sp. ISL-67]|uniref:ATP-binding cassette domain-containing protein n=1 Tax=Stenotrophomonas sp. ISL-67 TaxID=2819171 RepID=UPI001BE9CC43|nr:ATP-binding cassette domain-containing protein [Stenotrophomonas sp. ISL-67]MBT2767379.1 ATP-binding cassette domain-containing protein [Stenotrophomonas sp. ISL-67]
MWLELDIHRQMDAPGQQFTLDVQLQCSQRQVVLFGPSGAGKSLTLKAIAGLLRPHGGHVRLGGATLFDAAQGVHLPPQQRRLGYVFQDYALFPHLTVRQNIAFGLHRSWLNPGRRATDPEVERWMAALRIEHLAQMLPAQLSGGQRQRTALARALVTRPQALLLDEPFAALDHALRNHLRQELLSVLEATDIPLLLISHDPVDVAMFGHQVVELADGRVKRP